MVYIFYVMLELGVAYALFKNLTNFKLSSFFQLLLVFLLYNILLQEVVRTEAVSFLILKLNNVPITISNLLALRYFYNLVRNKYVKFTY